MADQLVQRFFAGAESIQITPEFVESARLRVELGNPPGKRGSIGDAVNWEALLWYRPSDQLFFVTDDKDFYSPLDPTQAHEFLTVEWARAVGNPIDFVRRLSALPASVPHEVLPVEDAPDGRDELVARLVESWSFATTHQLIAQLRQIPSFTARQVRDLVAALDNSQVGGIITDDDVNSFYRWLAETHSEYLTDSDLAALRAMLTPPTFDAGADFVL